MQLIKDTFSRLKKTDSNEFADMLIYIAEATQEPYSLENKEALDFKRKTQDHIKEKGLLIDNLTLCTFKMRDGVYYVAMYGKKAEYAINLILLYLSQQSLLHERFLLGFSEQALRSRYGCFHRIPAA